VSNGEPCCKSFPVLRAIAVAWVDYSEQLARSLQELHGITSTFVSAAPVTSSRTADGFAVLSPLRTSSDVLDSPTALLLHYVNYGYSPRGVPVWLPSVLRRSQKRLRRTARDRVP
jgi:hypothetical protein